MGATQSKGTPEPVIFYNQNVPLQSGESPANPEEVEKLVRKRVAEELQRAKQQEDEVTRRSYGDLAKQNIENDYNSVAMGTDIENMIKRIQRPAPKEIPAEIAERQEAVIACYK
ncbi:hypothetical protein BCR43DRAFT_437339 [Syncephalastrum racemosum]|uniref:Uncharacterized protein n=1 Tax=Syncephalastrum racemosum TaxID=13706 RepID=A0A1X2HFD6_SYNRA|nr:hypothetical protein BCR43DRAFT_437339 [Syncephalastrum racemosum]